MKTKITLKKLGGTWTPEGSGGSKELTMSLQANLMRLGFIASEELSARLDTLSSSEISAFSNDLIPFLKALKGADVVYNPMYPNFPDQVMDASGAELLFNAIAHYWSLGTWTPDYEVLPREYAFEATKFQQIKLVTEEQYKGVFNKILRSSDSISQEDKNILDYFLQNESDLPFPSEIPFKENMAYMAGRLFELNLDVRNVVKTTTDVLRVLTVMSDGDVSLADNTKFKSLPRSKRRYWIGVLEDVIREEDVQRHRNKWIRLFHNLHVGDYSTKVYNIAKRFRNNETIPTFNSKVEAALKSQNWSAANELLKNRPGDFARRLDHVLRISRSNEVVADTFLEVVDRVPMRVLMQVLGHLKTRREAVKHRFVFPKGSTQHAVKIERNLPQLTVVVLNKLIRGIVNSIIARLSEQEKLGKVWIDPNLEGCPLPSQQRSASEGLFQVARGTRLPIGDKAALRFFIYWKGIDSDIDLSATFHDEKFKQIGQVSYTNLRGVESFHSGDITRAPNGAAEFIDVGIDGAVKAGARYVAMNVYVFSGPSFADHEICYAGWMTRDHVRSNEIFDPKTVVQKIDVRSQSSVSLPVMFDLVERKAIWMDIATKERNHFGGNNTHSNRPTIEEMVQCFVDSANKANLLELCTMHTIARGEAVEDINEADVVFTTDRGFTPEREGVAVVTPYDINDINADFIID
jgi:hypothetical protein